MDLAFIAEQDARRLRRDEAKVKQEASKHSMEAESSEQAAKRARLEVAGSGLGKGPEVDVSGFPLHAVVEAVLSGLHNISVDGLRASFEVSCTILWDTS